MKRIIVGIFILASLLVLPMVASLINSWSGIKEWPAFMVPLSKLIISAVVGSLIAVLFIHYSQLCKRLALKPKGAPLMLAGVVVFIAFPVILALTLREGYLIEALRFFPANGITHYPAYLLLLAGAVRVLLHLEPLAGNAQSGITAAAYVERPDGTFN